MELCPDHSRSLCRGFKNLLWRKAKNFFTRLQNLSPASLSHTFLSTLNQKGMANMAVEQRNARNRRSVKAKRQKVDEAPVAEQDVEMQESGATPSSGYCWTHGSSRNRRHTSMTCKNKHADHQDAATVTNKMGGSTEVIEVVTSSTPTDLTIQPYCWTHGLSKNPRHSSMTCQNKHADHEDEATFIDQMGGSTEVNQGTRPPTDPTKKSYCWTHGLSNNLSHTSMTCNGKHMNHQDGATATNKMGGSSE
jgi:hypothetical protein